MRGIDWNQVNDVVPEPQTVTFTVGPCGKQIYSERDAGIIINACRRHNHRTAKGYTPKRKYFCRVCRGWHVTHFKKPKRKR